MASSFIKRASTIGISRLSSAIRAARLFGNSAEGTRSPADMSARVRARRALFCSCRNSTKPTYIWVDFSRADACQFLRHTCAVLTSESTMGWNSCLMSLSSLTIWPCRLESLDHHRRNQGSSVKSDDLAQCAERRQFGSERPAVRVLGSSPPRIMSAQQLLQLWEYLRLELANLLRGGTIPANEALLETSPEA
jgi:hypothetical protein